MSKITKVTQIRPDTNDIFRVTGVFPGQKGRVCWIDHTDNNEVLRFQQVTNMVERFSVDIPWLQDGLDCGLVKIMCIERQKENLQDNNR